MRLLVVGAHPDDPESGCGGLACRAVRDGHDVAFVYATAYRRRREIFGRAERVVRSEEARAACAALGARPIIWEYAHEEIDIDRESAERFRERILSESPDIVVAHWPVDTHVDHRSVGILALSAYLHDRTRFRLYFFEVCLGKQTMQFHPTDFVDISPMAEVKRQSILCHKSQNPEGILADHDRMQRLRGEECGVAEAEAYVRMGARDTGEPCLPGLVCGQK